MGGIRRETQLGKEFDPLSSRVQLPTRIYINYSHNSKMDSNDAY